MKAQYIQTRSQANLSQLPWSTHEDEPWPRRKKYKKRRALPLETAIVTLQTAPADQNAPAAEQHSSGIDARDDSSHTEETVSTVNVATDTLTTSTPEPTKQHTSSSPQKSPSNTATAQPSKIISRSTVPTVPVVPALPKNGALEHSRVDTNVSEVSATLSGDAESQKEASEEQQDVIPAPRPSYRNWADILKPTTTSKASTTAKSDPNGITAHDGAEVASEQPSVLGINKSGTVALADVLKSYRVGGADKTGERLVFIEPRGLHNSGVDCFMNSVRLIPSHFFITLSPSR